MSLTPPSPAARFAALLQVLQRAVADRLRGGMLTVTDVVLICQRINLIIQRFIRLADRIKAGTYRPRRSPRRTSPTTPKPRKPNPLPTKFGWLVPLVPWVPLFPHTALTCRSNLQQLFDDPEMQTLLAAAPAEMGRLLRPLCWMLGLAPPPLLARPRRAAPAAQPAPSPPAPPPAAAPAPPDPPPPPQAAPASPAPSLAVPPQACGPPHPA